MRNEHEMKNPNFLDYIMPNERIKYFKKEY